MLPIARAAIRVQLDMAARTLRDLYANLPSTTLRVSAPFVLRGTQHLAPLRDRDLIAISDSLREDRALLNRLCPDVGQPSVGGLRDLQHALELADTVEDELPALNQLLRRTPSIEKAVASFTDPDAARAYLQAADSVIQVDDFER